MNWQPKQPVIKQLIQVLRSESTAPHLVGGAVRDLLLNPEAAVKDLDFVVPEPAIAIARRVANKLGWAFYPMDEAREVARILFVDGQHPPFTCDIARMRGDSIEDDLLARDFTVNALALRWIADGQTELVDVCGGKADLRCGMLRRVTSAALAEDSVRLLRAARLIAEFNFVLEHETSVQIRRLAHTIQLATPERVRDELWKCFASPNPVLALSEIRRMGLLSYTLPELAETIDVPQSPPHTQDVYAHTLSVVENAHTLRNWLRGDSLKSPTFNYALLPGIETWQFRLRQLFLESLAASHSRLDWLVWHAIFHDIGKPLTLTREPADATEPQRIRFFQHEEVGAKLAKERSEALRFSRQEVQIAARVVQNHMRPHHLYTSFPTEPVSRRAAYRFYRDVTIRPSHQIAAFDILLLALCDYTAIFAGDPQQLKNYQACISNLLAFGFEQIDQANGKRPALVDGRLLMRHFNLKPGKHIGVLLDQLAEAQAAGEITSVEEALALASQHLHQRPDAIL